MHELNSLQTDFTVELLRDKCNIESNSRIYGFILYTSSHPFVVKTLEDPAFWNALDEISGPNWPIFSVKPKSDKSSCRQKPRRAMKIMVPTDVDPSDNKKILNYFGISDTSMLPCFVAFIWDNHEQLKSIACKIASKPENAVYDSLEEIVDIISKVEANVPEEEEKTTEIVFQKVERALKMRNLKYVILDAIKNIKEIKDLIGLFRL